MASGRSPATTSCPPPLANRRQQATAGLAAAPHSGRREGGPFGDKVGPQIAPLDKRLFTGKERDAETGQDYFEARYLRSGVGRFTTIDPVYTWSENLEDPQRWNRYAYVRNNPLRYTDPDGRVIDGGVLEIATLVVAVTATVQVVNHVTSPQGREQVRRIGESIGQLVTTAVKGAADLLSPVTLPVPPPSPLIESRSKNHVQPDPSAAGPHSVPKRVNGEVTGYTTFDANGRAEKRVDIVGPSHGGVSTPHVHEAKPGKGPGASLEKTRPARPDELPAKK
jgi:RHS repeat-associated protein